MFEGGMVVLDWVFVSGQDAFVSLPTGFVNVSVTSHCPIAKHIQRYTYVLVDHQAYCVRSPTTCYNINTLRLISKFSGVKLLYTAYRIYIYRVYIPH